MAGSTTTPNRAPWPEAWGPDRPAGKSIAQTVGLALFAALLIAVAVDAGFGDDPIVALPFGIGAIGILALTFLTWQTRVKVRSRGSSGMTLQPATSEGPASIRIDEQGSPRVLEFLLLATIALVALVGLAASVATLIDDPGAGPVLTGLVAAVIVVILARQSARTARRGVPHLLLSPENLQRHSKVSVVDIVWNDVVTIRLSDSGQSYRIAILADAGNDIILSGGMQAADPALVYATLAFYAAHAESRVELGTTAALNRIREARFS